jgi:hypothetical protein
MDKKHLEDLAAFIRENRGNESNFEKLYRKLQEEATNGNGTGTYANDLEEIKEKSAMEYRKAKETRDTAWPEFEKFVGDFEKTITDALKETA